MGCPVLNVEDTKNDACKVENIYLSSLEPHTPITRTPYLAMLCPLTFPLMSESMSGGVPPWDFPNWN